MSANPLPFEEMSIDIREHYSDEADATVFLGDRLDMLREIPDGAAQLVVTSPPYNIGKTYEKRRSFDDYLRDQEQTIAEAARVLSPTGSLCWQVGNHVRSGEVIPLDIALYGLFKKLRLRLRNRIIWQFEHGLHCSRRFSGRYETILWFTASDDYTFNLDDVRVPQKYPGKRYFKGPKAGQYSCNPLGKNPGDVWNIPNVKHNHVEKTAHPCQFPVELVERLVLALTSPHDLVVDPYMGVGSSLIAAVLHGRRGAGADILPEYVWTARTRLSMAAQGRLRIRPMDRPIYEPSAGSSLVLRHEPHRSLIEAEDDETI